MPSLVSRIPIIARVLILRQLLWGAAFYGAYVLLTKYFLYELNYSQKDTIMMLGAFGAVGPVFSALGGFAADRYIGSFRAVYIGYVSYIVGFGLLGLAAAAVNIPLSIFSIALIGYARGLSSTSPTVLLGNAYPDDQRVAFQEGLTVNYAINNLGSFAAKYAFPFLIVYTGYAGNFFISAILVAITVLIFFIFRHRLTLVGNAIDKRPVTQKDWAIFCAGSLLSLGLVYWIFSNLDAGKYLLYSMGAGAIAYFIYEIKKASLAYQYKMSAVLILLIILVTFYFYYGQMFTSMNIYALNLMSDSIFGLIPIKPEANAAFNPMWCFLLGTPVIYIYSWLEKKGISPTIPTKFAAAFVFSSIAFLLLALSTKAIGSDGKFAADWILWAHFFQSLAELIVGALGIGFIFEMVPKHLKAFSIGLRSVTLSLSGILAAVISTKIALPKDIELTEAVIESVYTGYFLNLAILALCMAAVTLILSRVISNMLAKSAAVMEESKSSS